MNRADQAVTIARRWIGTPYRHQATREGAGSDCLGLLRGIWREMYGAEPEPVPPYTSDWADPRKDELLLSAAMRWLVPRPIDCEDTGDVLLFRMRHGALAQHVGIQSGIGTAPAFIHAYDRHGVIESPLSQPWLRRIAARFAFPEETA